MRSCGNAMELAHVPTVAGDSASRRPRPVIGTKGGEA